MVACSLSGAPAQDRKDDGKAGVKTNDAELVDAIRVGVVAQQGDNAFQLISQEAIFDNRLVKGAPFSAEIVSETIQTLLDGNRIVQRSEGRIYRDSDGRTRSERAYQMGGSNEQKQTITIYDPVANVNSILDPEARIARKTPFFFGQGGRGGGLDGVVTLINPDGSAEARKIPMAYGILQGLAVKKVQPPYPPIARAAGAQGAVQVQVLISETGEVIEATVVSGHPLLRGAALEAARQWQFKPTEVSEKVVKVRGILTFNFTLVDNENQASVGAARRVTKYSTNTEQLGKQMVEGVECEGARTVTTIPIGAVGNERPLETVGETWYSPELKMIILSKRSDPRFGESTYRVTNISRSEPETTLFQVPSDYAVKDSGFIFKAPASDTEIKNEVKIERKARKPDNQ
jgi:TonB family protein